MSDKYILDENGQPVPCDDLFTWGRWMETAKRSVQTDRIGDIRVSTVFLGLDHSFIEGGAPILFETMIFGGEHDGYQDRYTSREEALAGHVRALALVQAQG